MALGGVVGFSRIEMPFVETGIALSIVVLGAVVAFGITTPVTATTGLVGFFAIFHGYAHGAEMPETWAALCMAAISCGYNAPACDRSGWLLRRTGWSMVSHR